MGDDILNMSLDDIIKNKPGGPQADENTRRPRKKVLS